MYRVPWTALVTDDVLRRLASAAGIRGISRLEPLRPILARVFANVGGLPTLPDRPSIAERTARGLTLLHDAVCHVLMRASGPSDRRDGYVVRKEAATPAAESVARRVTRIRVNMASERDLADVGFGAAVAQRIVETRQRDGAYTSLQDLDDRVAGIGPQMVERVAHACRFDAPAMMPEAYAGSDLEQDVRQLLARMPGDDEEARVVALVDALATVTARSPHPATKQRRIRRDPAALLPPGTATDWIGVLFGYDYFRLLPATLDATTTSIDVAMFHVACPSPTHPTRQLLDALIRAHQRGVRVRVLIDQDRDTDPYKSTVINTPARDLLKAAGVDCRFDRAETLLHSKFLILDGASVVIGSHNWSAGSYFQFDDLSLVIRSNDLAGQLTERFGRMWAAT
jgi:DNA uptake protein ComE-like DNA-binding protein